MACSVTFLLMGTVSLPDSNNYLTKLKNLHSISVLHFYFPDNSFGGSNNIKQRCLIGIIIVTMIIIIIAKIYECFLCCRQYAKKCSCIFSFNPHPIMYRLLLSPFYREGNRVSKKLTFMTKN